MLLLLCGLAACEPCDRDGCEALRRAAPDTGKTRIAGVVASLSDVVDNGCQECGFADAELRAWGRQGPTDPSELDAILASPELARSETRDGSYELELVPGDYLLCAVQDYCFDVTLREGATTTLNIRLTYGPARGYASEPGSAGLVEVESVR